MRLCRFKICLSFTIIIMLGLLLGACESLDSLGKRGSGRVITDQRNVNGVSAVNLATIGHMTIEVGDTESLRIEAEDNLMPYIKTEMSNGELMIKNQEHVNLDSTSPIRYYLTVKSLDSIAIFSSGDIQAPDLESRTFSITVASTGDLDMGALKADRVNVKISSSGDVKMRALNANMLDVNISSTGDLEIAGGEVKMQTIVLSSSGDYMARNLASDDAAANLNSTGSATIWVRNRLNANLNSSGDLNYIGSPTVNAKTNSTGDVTRIGR